MKYLTFTITCLIIFSSKGFSQTIKYDKYNEGLWEIIDFASTQETPIPSDTMVVLCTIRNFNLSSYKKFNNKIDSNSTIKIILAIYKNNRWKIHLMNTLDEAVFYLPEKKNIVVYVEGTGKTFTTNLYRSAGLSIQYNVNVIMFDYPTAEPSNSTIQNFKLAKRNAIQSAPSFYKFINNLQESLLLKKEWIVDKNITFFHHSMGNKILENSILIPSSKTLKENIFSTLVLNAPCVNHKNHTKWIDSLTYVKRIIINYNNQDKVLKGAMLLTFRKQLGAKIRKPLSKNTVYVNINGLLGNKHSYFLNRPNFTRIPDNLHNYYYKLFQEENIEWENSKLFKPNNKYKGFNLFNIL